MKKIAAFILAAIMLFIACSCSQTSAQNVTPEETGIETSSITVPEGETVYTTYEEAQKALEEKIISGEQNPVIYTTSDIDEDFIYTTYGQDENEKIIKTSKDSLSDLLYVDSQYMFSDKTLTEEGYIKWDISILNYFKPEDKAKIDDVVTDIVSSVTGNSDKEKIYSLTALVEGYFEYDTSVNSFGNAIQTKQGDCAHYSELFYLCAKELGYDCRILAGKSGEYGHVWNLIEVGSKWYYVDATPVAIYPFGQATFDTLKSGRTLDSRYADLNRLYDISENNL